MPPDPRTDKSRAAFHQELMEATIKRRQKLDGAAYDERELNPEQIGYLAAKIALKCDPTLTGARRSRATVEAMRILCAMLGKNPTLAMNLKTAGIEVVIVSADRPMTDLPEFSSLSAVSINQSGASGAARGWDQTRGAGGLSIGSKVYVAVTEENLVGGDVGAMVKAVGGGCYAASYSTTSHEFAHSLHLYVLDARQKGVITTAYNQRKEGLTIHGDVLYFDGNSLSLKQAIEKPWVDGPRMAQSGATQTYKVANSNGAGWRSYTYTTGCKPMNCYAAVDEKEYFAQCVNAYLGTNGGSDPYTRWPRNNGAAWIRSHEPTAMTALLDELFSPHGTSVDNFSGFGAAELPNTNVAIGPDDRAVKIRDLIAKQQRHSRSVKEKVAFFENVAKKNQK
ncbi:MAG TPA: hypothetical protein VG125_11435 [Pirellulales bacterium]|jgi:hypothetical protein|nr:hypothetical protein [Pirellulales bacterium]